VLPVSLRRWRKQDLLGALREGREFARRLRRERYDVVVDAQGLLKSAWIVSAARKGDSVGYDWASAKEPLASLPIRRKLSVSKDLHAVLRTRILMAAAVGYEFDEDHLEFGIRERFLSGHPPQGLVFVIGSSASSRLWHLEGWRALARKGVDSGYPVTVVWGSEAERNLALQIQDDLDGVTVARERQSIKDVAGVLANAQGVVGLDTGFTHLSSALEVPTVALHGSTSPKRSGVVGDRSRSIEPQIECHPCNMRVCPLTTNDPPCLVGISPERVWEELTAVLEHQSS
jgi:heptosyltransferase-1